MTRLILPGWHGSGPGHWQTLWLEQDPTAVFVDQEDWARPDLESWLAHLDAAVERSPGATLVGHSLGVILVAHYAHRRPRAPIGAALLVAPGDADHNAASSPEIASFAPVPRDRFRFPSIMVVSRTDPYMTYERSCELARDLGSETVDLGAAGHVNLDSGFGPWPLGFELAARVESRIRSEGATQ